LADVTASVNPTQAASRGKGIGANNSFIQQWARLGIGYDLSPDVNFYVELIYSHDWGTTANPANGGQAGGPALNNNCGQAGANGCADAPGRSGGLYAD
jgi:hypothetical protein